MALSGLISLAAALSRLVSSSGDPGTRSSPPKKALLSSGLPLLAEGTDLLEKTAGIEEEKYLCIHHGSLIYCLDLKRGKVELDPQPLPIIGSFRYPESFQSSISIHDDLDEFRMMEHLLRCMDQLSLLTLGLSSAFLLFPFCNTLPPLRNPKFFWPVVEKIGNQIHIFESVPYGMSDPSFTPSHEIFNLDNPDHGWEAVPPMQDWIGRGIFMQGHVVLGDKIFAKHRCSVYEEFSVFNCSTKKWERHTSSVSRERHTFSMAEMHLTQYSMFDCSICVEQFYKKGYESPFYLVIMFDNRECSDDGILEVSATALGVTEKGYVHWTQGLPQFFDGLAPMTVMFAHVFYVDERTMCVVMFANYYAIYLGERDVEDVLYIATFFVEEGSQCREGGVKVVLKERHVYKVGKDFPNLPQRLRACVSTFPKGRHL